jgi:hypothetical protein
LWNLGGPTPAIFLEQEQGVVGLRHLEAGNTCGPAVANTEGMMVEAGEDGTTPEYISPTLPR